MMDITNRRAINALISTTRIDCDKCGGEQDITVEKDKDCPSCEGRGFTLRPQVEGKRREWDDCRECRTLVMQCKGCGRKHQRRIR